MTYSVVNVLGQPVVQDGIDPRLKMMSYSGNLTLHSCPRKFELYRLKYNPCSEEQTNIDFLFGHVVGTGVQELLCRIPLEQVVFNAAMNWTESFDFFSANETKSVFHAINALCIFHGMLAAGYLEDWEVLEHGDGKFACELGFALYLPDNFVYRGFADCVMRNKYTGKIRVVEVKTEKQASLSPAKYGNSAQAIGYSIILDSIVGEYSDYDVLYLPFAAKTREFNPQSFRKTIDLRARWIREVMLDADTIKLYSSANVFPMRGESCFDFYRECPNFGSCHMSNQSLIPLVNMEEVTEALYKELQEKYHYHVSIETLINKQLELANGKA